MENIVQQTFPLLKLPVDALKNVLQNMEVLHLLGFSFCSKASLELATSVNLKAIYTSLHISDDSYFIINFQLTNIILNFCPKPNPSGQPIQLSELERVSGTVFGRGADVHWENFAHTARDLFQHVFSVFHLKKIRRVDFTKDTFEVESLKESFKGLEIAEIGFLEEEFAEIGIIDDSIPNEYAREVLSQFSHVPRFVIQRNPFETATQARKFYIQNLTGLRLYDTTSLTINDLLMSNCSRFSAFSSNLWSGKVLNRWLKLWRSGCNPNLRCFEIKIVNGRVEDVLKGLNAQTIPATKTRVFEQSDLDFTGERREKTRIRGGFDIRRSGGTCATITLLEKVDAFNFAFYVWS
ncbi:hypothetical protein CAEBREN_12033 [Caenorhabditis brenneri]|uniref:F-box domain-containing protein n=1 Tax=Caenorhabditis brenneri TaxID=135651 RepID=G0MC04_CAEBE|nr:hypothetical protein CAEBREN_12033 [Caenorhabditis brenneri]